MAWQAIVDHRAKWFGWMRRGLIGAIVAFLAYRLTEIGWSETINAFPTSPFFYLFSVLIFLAVPASEVLNYRLITGVYIPAGLMIFSRKRVFNDALFSYSGEGYLCHKLSELPGFDLRAAAVVVKDNNLISALVSNSWAILLVMAAVMFGRSEVIENVFSLAPPPASGFAIAGVIVFCLCIVFFRKLSGLRLLTVIQVAMVHSGKVLITAALLVAQWASAIPAEAPTTWLLFLAVHTLIKRIPGLPSSDLVFLGVGLSIVGFADANAEKVTAMFVAATAMTQLVQLVTYVVSSRINAGPQPPVG